jgi:hypothetical protein
MTHPTCATCAFFKAEAERIHYKTGDVGILNECRAHPPKPEANRFPNVKETDWCGEYKTHIGVGFFNVKHGT